jgi:hypothetical protein
MTQFDLPALEVSFLEWSNGGWAKTQALRTNRIWSKGRIEYTKQAENSVNLCKSVSIRG